MLLPRPSLAGMVDSPVMDRDEALFALAAVVTREGRCATWSCCCRMPGTPPVSDRAIGALLDAVSQTRFEPARALGGAPVAVNLVWLVAHTRCAARR